MGIQEINNFTDNETITVDKINQTREALKGDIVGRDSGGRANAGENLGNSIYPFGDLYLDQNARIRIGNTILDSNSGNAIRYGIIDSIKKDGRANYLDINTNETSIVLKATTTNPFIIVINGEEKNITSNLSLSLTISVSERSPSQSIGWVNNAPIDLKDNVSAVATNSGATRKSFLGGLNSSLEGLNFRRSNGLFFRRNTADTYLATINNYDLVAYCYATSKAVDLENLRLGYFYDEFGDANDKAFLDNEINIGRVRGGNGGSQKIIGTGTATSGRTSTGSYQLFAINYWQVLFNGATNSLQVYKKAIEYSPTEPTGAVLGDIWFDSINKIYKIRNATVFENSQLIPVGKIFINSAGLIKQYSCLEFERNYSNLNTLGIPLIKNIDSTNRAVFNANRDLRISVMGNELSIATGSGSLGAEGLYQVALSGSYASNTTYILYLGENGSFLAENVNQSGNLVFPKWSEILKGFYHPFKNFRAVGSFDVDSSINTLNNVVGQNPHQITGAFDKLRLIQDFEVGARNYNFSKILGEQVPVGDDANKDASGYFLTGLGAIYNNVTTSTRFAYVETKILK